MYNNNLSIYQPRLSKTRRREKTLLNKTIFFYIVRLKRKIYHAHEGNSMYTDFYGQKWYKGNLHTHTLRSDGKVSFEEAVSRYRHLEYDFLSITDHWIPSETKAEKKFLLLSGCEYDIKYFETINGFKRQVVMHINGVGFTSPPKLEKKPGLKGQEIIDAIRDVDGIAVFNHPEWSRNLPSDIIKLRNLAGIEIFNSECGSNEWHFNYSGFHVDQLALMGQNYPVFAFDDAHHFTGEEGQSFIMVRANDLSRKSIMDAIGNGHFYASQGPWLHTEVTGRSLRIICSPVLEIRVFSNSYGGWSRKEKVPVTGAVYQLPASAFYYRVEVIDKNGNRAWTSPVSIS